MDDSFTSSPIMVSERELRDGSGRTQEVVVEGQRSDRVPVTSGVPKGSVLCPCLFFHYIIDLPEGIGSTVRLFADDTVMYLTIASQTDSHKLQTDFKKSSQKGENMANAIPPR